MEIEVVGKLTKCNKCGRKILVEQGLFGVNHTLEVIATCWDCLDRHAQERAIKRYELRVNNKPNENQGRKA